MHIKEIQNNCIKYLESNDLISFDLYDALTNSFLDSISQNHNLLRRVIIQINARSPVNLRWLGMKKMIHTKSISDLLWYYSISAEQNKESNIQRYFKLLMENKNSSYYGWGLNFPFTSRFGSSNSNTPNLYNTVHAGMAICHAYPYLEKANKKLAYDALKGIMNFIEKELGFVDEGNKGWYLYYPGQMSPTYNVNALALYLIMQITQLINYDDKIIDSRIDKILYLLISEQNVNGSWNYARTETGKWIDGFHTAFIIESLAYVYKSGKATKELSVCIDKAWKFYKEEMFTGEAFPIYFYNGSKYPIESQNCAQAIQSISCMGLWMGIDTSIFLKRVMHNAVKNLYCKKGFFYHKKTRYWTFSTSYSRWSNTPMILALEYARSYLKSDAI